MSRQSHHWTMADYYALLARRSHAAESLHGGTPVPELPEKTLLDRLRQVARQTGALCYHTWRSKRSEEGFPDLVLVAGTTLYLLELKTTSGEVTAAQQRWIDQLQAVTRIEARVVRPADLAAIEDGLRGEGA